jgi:subtilisin family serine protease
LIRQTCPDADVVSWRIVPGIKPILESELITALAQIAELVRRHHEGLPGGHPIDVVNLSMGYYHETPFDALFDLTLQPVLDFLGRHGTVVVCSAGNDGTSRPMFPAALWEWSDGTGPVHKTGEIVRPVSAGALNPNGTDALFSNAGPWVRCHAPGAAVMSTMPPFEGGLPPASESTAYGRKREAIDPDDFTGQFAVWSGTSFAAPVIAGRIADALLHTLPGPEAPLDAKKARALAAKAIEAVVAATT